MGLGMWRLGTWIGCCIHLLILIGDAQATAGASTVYARHGETVTLSWDLPTPGLKTFTVNTRTAIIIHERVYKKSEIFRVTNYNTVTMMSNIPKWKMQFLGNITPWGTGVFSFMLHDVTWSDYGHYRCFIPSSHPAAAAEVPGCGRKLVVYDFQPPYIGAPDTAHVDRSVTLSCCSLTRSYRFLDVNVSIEWRRNGLLLSKSSKVNITPVIRYWMTRLYISKLTVSDTANGDNFQCQFVFGRIAVTGWSEVYALVKQPASFENYTVVREGHSALIVWKMPLAGEHIEVWTPIHTRFFDVLSTMDYVLHTYHPRVRITKVTTSADSIIVQFWLHNTTSEDAGRYYCSKVNDDPIPTCHHMLYVQDTPESNLPLVAGSSVAAVIVALGIIAGLILSRLNQLRDYWNLRFRSYITPLQNMPENIDEREYAEIDDADLSGNIVQAVLEDNNIPPLCGARHRRERQELEGDDADLSGRGGGNIVQAVLDDNNIPPLYGARHRRERQQVEGEDGDYEEVRPLGATNREQERTADMPQPDTELLEDITDEMVMMLAGSHSHPERVTVAADWLTEGGESGNMAAAIINQFAETSFMTQEPDETDTDKLPTASGLYTGIDGMTAVETDADRPLVEEREGFVESEPLDLPCNRYESLMLSPKQDPYTVLDNNDVSTHV